MRYARPVAVAIALIALAACGSPVFPATLDPAHVPVVAIGFEGQSDTFPYPGGIVPVLVRATVSDPSGQNVRSWSPDPGAVEDLKFDAVGYSPPGPRTKFAFALGDRMLDVPASGATVSSPAIEIMIVPWGGTLIVDRTLPADAVWVEIRVVFDDTFDGRPARIDATYGFWVSP
ncbi:MAG TPA: hypothetical protein VEO91_09905 [Candidatus Limnocylindria bacterium]|nr:hypothetical protein [Candidatus Limnocylindria bacterium]